MTMAELEVNIVLDALKFLVSSSSYKSKEAHTESAGASVLDKILKNNLDRFLEMLNSEKFSRLQKIYEENRKTVPEQNPSFLKTKFVEVCLAMLYTLHIVIQEKLTDFRKAEKPQKELKPSEAPPLSPDTLSIDQQKTLISVLQFVVILGISPHLQPGVGLPVEKRSEFGKLISESEEFKDFSSLQHKFCLLRSVRILLFCIKTPSVGEVILSRHLNDLLASLLQLVHGSKKVLETPIVDHTPSDTSKSTCDSSKWTPASVVDMVIRSGGLKNTGETFPSDKIDCKNVQPDCDTENFTKTTPGGSQEDTYFCEEALRDLIERIHPPLLVRELLMLQGAPSSKVTKKSVNSKPVLHYSPVWLKKICGRLLSDILMRHQGVINIIKGMLGGISETGTTSSPDWRKFDAVAMVIAKCPSHVASVEQYYKHIAPQIVDLLQLKDKQIGRGLLRVACTAISNMAAQHFELTEKYIFQNICHPLFKITSDNEIECSDSQIIVVTESEWRDCIENLHKIFISGIGPNCNFIRCLIPICQPLFEVFCFVNGGPSHLSSAAVEVLVFVLKQLDICEGLSVLKKLITQKSTDDTSRKMKMLHPALTFAVGSEGGAITVTKMNSTEEKRDLNKITLGMVHVLKSLQQSGLTGEFLLFIMKELQKIIADEISPKECDFPTPDTPQSLLEMENKQEAEITSFNNKMITLHLLGKICEEIGPGCIKSAKQTLEFVKTTLVRAIQVCTQTNDEVTSVFESETLTMAMGLLTAMLSGAVEMADADKIEMETLMPLLEEISNTHPDPDVQEMTSDLRIAIATHGAVWSEKIEEKAKWSSQVNPNQSKRKAKANKKSLIEDISCDNPKCNENDPQIQTQETLHGIEKCEKHLPCLSCDNVELGVEKLSEDGTTNAKVSDATERKLDSNSKSELEQALEEICDPLLPVRGHALITLCKLIRKRDTDAVKKKEVILKIFKENLKHSDSYLYLSSVNGLVAMADLLPETVIPKLVQEYREKVGNENKSSSETRMKFGECLVLTLRNLGDLAPKYRDVMISAILNGTKDTDPLVRASSMSNLGEMCSVLRYNLGTIMHEVFTCCSSLLRSDDSSEVRKASALTITLLFRGLGPNSVKVLDSVIRDLYRLLKLMLTTEKDESVYKQVLIAYNELEDIMKEVLFPKQILQKRIRVLDAE